MTNLKVGQRVRLQSGDAYGTITDVSEKFNRVLVMWDTGNARKICHPNDLVVLEKPKKEKA